MNQEARRLELYNLLGDLPERDIFKEGSYDKIIENLLR